MKKVCFAALALLITLMFAGCSGGTDVESKEPEAASSTTTVNFLNWGDYIDPDVIPQFEEENPDIKINMTTVDSNEAMYAIVSTEGSQINMMIPSEYMLQRMMEEDMLAEIDTSALENFKHVEDFTKTTCAYDPEGRYSLPYSWGTFGILYNDSMVEGEITGWGDLFDEKYKGKVLMYDSMRDSLGVALLELGYSLNSTDEAEINEAADLLIEQKPLVMAYGTDDLRMSMVNGSAALCVMYAGDAAYSMQDNEDLKYMIPQNGANIFVDAMCVMSNTEGETYDKTLRFIDFMLSPEIAAKNAEYTGYSTPEDAALEYISQEMLDNYAFNPDKPDLENCEYYEHIDKGALKLYEEAWMRVKAG